MSERYQPRPSGLDEQAHKERPLSVIFERHHLGPLGVYNPGDAAGFPEAQAKALVDQGFARWDERLNPRGQAIPLKDIEPKLRASIIAGTRAEGVPEQGKQVQK
jgi:hypothetical protein